MMPPEKLVEYVNENGEMDVMTMPLRYPSFFFDLDLMRWLAKERLRLLEHTAGKGGQPTVLYCRYCGLLHGVSNRLAALVGGRLVVEKKFDGWCDCGQGHVRWNRVNSG